MTQTLGFDAVSQSWPEGTTEFSGARPDVGDPMVHLTTAFIPEAPLTLIDTRLRPCIRGVRRARTSPARPHGAPLAPSRPPLHACEMDRSPDEVAPNTTTASSPPPAPTAARSVALAGAMGALAVVASVAGIAVRFDSGGRVPALAVTAASLLCFKLVVDRLARWAAPSQGVVATSIVIAGLSPLFAMGGLWALADPIVSSSWRCGTAEMSMLMSAPVIFFLAGLLGTLVCVGLLGGGRGEAMRPLLRRAAQAVTLAAAALVLLSVVRAARKPDIDAYIDSLPITATLPAANELLAAPLVRPSIGMGSAEPDSPQTPVPPSDLDGFSVVRACTPASCSVAILDAGARASGVEPRFLRSLGTPDTPIIVRRDEAHRFVVLEGPGRVAFGEIGAHVEPWGSTREAAGVWPVMDIGVRRVARSASPPVGWIVGGGLGLAVACALLAVNRVRSRRLRSVLEAARGTLADNGWIHFEDERPAARVDPAAGIPSGPVLVRTGSAAPGVYRESGLLGRADVLAGTRERWLERAEAAEADLHAWAMAAAAVCTAPLAAAMSAGLVV